MLAAQFEYKRWCFMHQWAEQHVAQDEEAIRRHTESLKKNQAESAEMAQIVLLAGLEIAKLNQ